MFIFTVKQGSEFQSIRSTTEICAVNLRLWWLNRGFTVSELRRLP